MQRNNRKSGRSERRAPVERGDAARGDVARGDVARGDVARGDATQTRENILNAARAEFSSHGFSGSRIEKIAKRARVNNQALYYHFGSKEDLYLAALQDGYAAIRRADNGDEPEPERAVDAMRRLIETFFNTVVRFRDVVDLVADENRLKGRHLKGVTPIRDLNRPFIAQVEKILRRGVDQGVFRDDVDPRQLWISIVSLSQFYLSNSYTLSHILASKVDSPSAVQRRREHVTDFVLAALRK